MYLRIRAVALTCVAGGLLAIPAPAGATTKDVSMGVPGPAQKSFQKHNIDANDFFPHGITIRAGDSVRFLPSGFHTVDIPAKGKNRLPLVGTGGPVSGVNDAAGNPFWFNGQPQLNFNPQFVVGDLGKKVTYTGKARVESGLPLSNHPKPMVVRFTKPGTYRYFCNIHPGMSGVVHVVSRKAHVPGAKTDAAAVKKQIARDLKEGNLLARTRPGSGVVQIGAAAAHGVESYGFFPSTDTVPVGTTITFRMPVGSTEEHTATTGPGNPETQPNSYLGQLAASFNAPQFAPAAVYSSEQPGGQPGQLTPTFHGNGFWNSGVLDSAKGTPLPSSNSVKFTAPGTYEFYCLIHPFMHATVVVK